MKYFVSLRIILFALIFGYSGQVYALHPAHGHGGLFKGAIAEEKKLPVE